MSSTASPERRADLLAAEAAASFWPQDIVRHRGELAVVERTFYQSWTSVSYAAPLPSESSDTFRALREKEYVICYINDERAIVSEVDLELVIGHPPPSASWDARREQIRLALASVALGEDTRNAPVPSSSASATSASASASAAPRGSASRQTGSLPEERFKLLEWALNRPAPPDRQLARQLAQLVSGAILRAQGQATYFLDEADGLLRCSADFPLVAYIPELHTERHSCGLTAFEVLVDNLLRRNGRLHQLFSAIAWAEGDEVEVGAVLGSAIGPMGTRPGPGVYIETPDWQAVYVGMTGSFSEREDYFLRQTSSAEIAKRSGLNRKICAAVDAVPTTHWDRLAALDLKKVPVLGQYLAETILNICMGATRWTHLNVRFVDGLRTEGFQGTEAQRQAKLIWDREYHTAQKLMESAEEAETRRAKDRLRKSEWYTRRSEEDKEKERQKDREYRQRKKETRSTADWDAHREAICARQLPAPAASSS
ncbi:hypothetical protein OC834_007383 [Tilletia horrida]|nr:hypothetical protein OC834_007383 [Tilletia horrida]